MRCDRLCGLWWKAVHYAEAISHRIARKKKQIEGGKNNIQGTAYPIQGWLGDWHLHHMLHCSSGSHLVQHILYGNRCEQYLYRILLFWCWICSIGSGLVHPSQGASKEIVVSTCCVQKSDKLHQATTLSFFLSAIVSTSHTNSRIEGWLSWILI